MKLVYQADREDEARGIKIMLEANGIPAALTGEFMFGVMSVGIPQVVGVWVYLDRQAEDARRLLEDPEHMVTDPVDVAEFYRISEDAARQAMLNRMLRFVLWTLMGMLALIGLLVLLVDHEVN
jgi:hypothetical protein